jgi:hypothetical protein
VAVSRVGCGELFLGRSSVTAKSSRSCYIVPMPTNLHRYYGARYSHYITTSWAGDPPFLFSPPRSNTVGAPSLRFLQGRVRCCLHDVVSGSDSIRPSLQASVVPALRTEREGRRTPFIANASGFKSLGHPAPLPQRTRS